MSLARDIAGAPTARPQDPRTTVLLTAFGPFPGVPVNATMRLVPELAERAALAFPDVRFVTEMLATEWLGAPRRMAAVIAEVKPDLILHFGVSSRARGFEIEQRAHNACRSMPDAAGLLPRARDAERRRRRRAAHQPARAASRAGPEAARHSGLCLARCGRLPVQCGAVPLAADRGGQAAAIAVSASCTCRPPWRGRAVPIAAGSAPVRSPGRRPSKAVSRSSPAASAARCPGAGRKRWPARACRPLGNARAAPAARAALTLLHTQVADWTPAHYP